MERKAVKIDSGVYELLKSIKQPNESFSEELVRLVRRSIK